MNQPQLPTHSPTPSSGEPPEKSVFAFQVRKVVDQILDQYQKAVDGEMHSTGPYTGFERLDDMLNGLAPGLHLLASRPSMGKTSFMLNIVDHMCVEEKLPCLIFSADSTAYQLTRSMIFSRANQPARMTYAYSRPPEEADQLRLRNAASEIANAPLFIDDSFDLTVESLQHIATRYKQDENIGFIAIDHLHLLRSVITRTELSREREIVEIVARIRSLARELNVPILLIAGMGRQPEYRRRTPAGMPLAKDVRYFDLIEGFATSISLLYRASYYAETLDEKEALEGKADLNLCKNPNGNTGHIELRFDSTSRRFEESEPEWI
jgi:replicative DNA helicase